EPDRIPGCGAFHPAGDATPPARLDPAGARATMKQHAPAALRNREPILGVLREVLPSQGRVLEIASGKGEHAVYFARALPGIEWQPTDVDPIALASIAAHRDDAALPNLLPPRVLDASAGDFGELSPIDAIV